MICDQPDISSAAVMTYTGFGLSYNGVPLVAVPPKEMLVLNSDPACPVTGGDRLTFPPAKPALFTEVLQPYVPHNLFSPGNCRVDSADTQMYCPQTNSTGEIGLQLCWLRAALLFCEL
jgi:hypothetical protein